MRAWSTIVARGPCLMINLSAGVASGRCPIDNIFIFALGATGMTVEGRGQDRRSPPSFIRIVRAALQII